MIAVLATLVPAVRAARAPKPRIPCQRRPPAETRGPHGRPRIASALQPPEILVQLRVSGVTTSLTPESRDC